MLWVGLGGFLGANARYLLGGWVAQRYGTEFPWGTFLINLAGSFILGFFLTLHLDRGWFPPQARFLVAVGWCASFTTFSTFSYETFRLISAGQGLLATANVLISVVVCLAGTWAGVAAGRFI